MLYLSGYINSCLRNTFDIVTFFFDKLNSCLLNTECKKKYSSFYNFENLSKLEEIVIYEQPRFKKSKSDSCIDIKFNEYKDNDININVNVNNEDDNDWDILE